MQRKTFILFYYSKNIYTFASNKKRILYEYNVFTYFAMRYYYSTGNTGGK